MGPPPVIGQDRQDDEQAQERGHLILFEVDKDSIGCEEDGVKQLLSDALDVHVGPEGEQDHQDRVDEDLQQRRPEEVVRHNVEEKP